MQIVLKYIFKYVLFILVFVLLNNVVFAQKAVLGKEKQHYDALNIFPDSIVPREDGMRTTGKKGTFEWWYFDAHMDDGTKIVIVFFTKPTHKVRGRLNPLCTVDIDWPDGSKIHKEYNAPIKESQFSEEQCEVYMGNNYFKGDLKHYDIHFEDDSLTVNIKLDRTTPSWRPHTGHWYFGKRQKKYFAWFPAVPSGEVSATIQYRDEKKELSGSGYHDHNWYNKNILMMFNHWYWARAEVGNYSVILSHLTTTKKYDHVEFPIVMITKNGKIVADDESKLNFAKKGIAINKETGKPVADKLIFDYEEMDMNFKVTFNREQIIFINKMIESTKGFPRLIAKLSGFDGAYIRFTGEVSLEVYEKHNLIDQQQENAIWELMYFRKNLE